ncbi:hypothetical protein chiPu_0014023 [Chiloscyllium punctatum]|uniref:Uncharacterized protein n=1 Tax=Chiloscyllium punctatum TaxID=137246 RepID=A0A401SYS1_CHIPU|nr:hypothetical protein [Chiloscyllium punctatum]
MARCRGGRGVSVVGAGCDGTERRRRPLQSWRAEEEEEPPPPSPSAPDSGRKELRPLCRSGGFPRLLVPPSLPPSER